MQVITEIQTSMRFMKEAPGFPEDFLNCYEIDNLSSLAWPINLYTVRRSDRKKQNHEDRKILKDIFFELRKKHRNRCKGYGFVVDIDEQSVVVPADWDIPDVTNHNGYDVNFSHTFLATGNEPNHRPIIVGIVKEGVKKHFKEHLFSYELGSLWQDYGSFCQMPAEATESGYNLCRRFTTLVKALRSNRLVVECVVSTTMIDGRTLADYYRTGEVDVLAGMIETKRQQRMTRKDRPPEIRVWHNMSSEHMTAAEVLELDEPHDFITHAKLAPNQQRNLRIDSVNCRAYLRSPAAVALRELRLMLDPSILGEGHSDTIIEPDERESLSKKVRDFVSGANIYGKSLTLAKLPFDVSKVPGYVIAPPALRVRGDGLTERVIQAPLLDKNGESNLIARARERAKSIRNHGFLSDGILIPCSRFRRNLERTLQPK